MQAPLLTRLVQHHDQAVELWHRNVLLFRYTYRPDRPQMESPRPYFHPLRTLRGNLVTIFRPTDHAWHHGLSLTCAELSGQNFWGGVTYVRDHGYQQLDNNGSQQHLAWDHVRFDAGLPALDETLQWVTQSGDVWLHEQRRMEVAAIEIDQEDEAAAAGTWELRFATTLTNRSGRTLELGSPTTAGRPKAGYGGLAWRGPRSFVDGRILIADGTEGEEQVMGKPSPWLAFQGRHDGSWDDTTLLFVEDPANPRYPSQWFARNGYAPMVGTAFMYDQIYPLPADAELRLAYRLLIADGLWSDDQIRRRAHAAAT